MDMDWKQEPPLSAIEKAAFIFQNHFLSSSDTNRTGGNSACDVASTACISANTPSHVHVTSADRIIRKSFTGFHNGEDDNVSVFLGEISSPMHHSYLSSRRKWSVTDLTDASSSPFSSSSSSSSCVQQNMYPSEGSGSLECVFAKLPEMQSLTNQTETLAVIPCHSWMIPFMVVNMKQEVMTSAMISAMDTAGLDRASVCTNATCYVSIVEDSPPSALPPMTSTVESFSSQTTSKQRKHFKSWCCLGKMFVSRDPQGIRWEQRLIFAADTYLFEVLKQIT